MKKHIKILSLGMAFLLLSLTACHKQGCPGKITDTETDTKIEKVEEV